MKKRIMFFCIGLILCRNAVFAEPSEKEIGETFQGLMGVYGLTMMQAMFGMTDGKSLIATNDEKTKSFKLEYKNYPAKNLREQLFTEKEIKIPFDYITGTIIMQGKIMDTDGLVGMQINVQLKGGSVKTIVLKIDEAYNNDKTKILLKINGKTYSKAKEFLEQLEKK